MLCFLIGFACNRFFDNKNVLYVTKKKLDNFWKTRPVAWYRADAGPPANGGRVVSGIRGLFPRRIFFLHGQKNLRVTLTTAAVPGTCYASAFACTPCIARTRNVRSIPRVACARARGRLGEESERLKHGNVCTGVVDLGISGDGSDGWHGGPPRVPFLEGHAMDAGPGTDKLADPGNPVYSRSADTRTTTT